MAAPSSTLDNLQEPYARAVRHQQLEGATPVPVADAAAGAGRAVRVHVHTPYPRTHDSDDDNDHAHNKKKENPLLLDEDEKEEEEEQEEAAAERHKRNESKTATSSSGGGGSTLSIKLSITLASVYLFTSMFFFLSIRYAQTNSKIKIDSACLVLSVELTKMMLTTGLLFYEKGQNLLAIMFVTGDVSNAGGGSCSSGTSRSANRKALWKRGLPLAVPAFIYAVYNNLTFFNLNRFHAGTYQVLMQSRILFTGLLFTTVLRQSLTLRKWCALVLLTFGLALKYLSPHLEFDGYMIVMLMQAMLSALAGVYNEYYLKEDMQLSIHVQNFFMYFYGIVFNVVLGVLFNPSAFLHLDFSAMLRWQVAPIILFGASTGIAAAFILKFINVIVKAIASAVEVSLTAVFALVLLGEPFSPRDVPSALVVTAAIAVYYTKGWGEGRSCSLGGSGGNRS